MGRLTKARVPFILSVCAAGLGVSLAAQAVAVPPPPPPAPQRIEIITGQSRSATTQPQVTPKPLVATSVIVGRVIDPSTERGVGGVVVTLNGGPTRPPSPGPQPLVVAPQILTDSDGRFAFRALTRGNYTIQATKSGYSAGAFGRMRPGGPTKPLQIDDGEKLNDVTIRIFKLGSISGQVMDETGEPIVAAQVRIYRRALMSGRRVLVQANSATTDDRGMYRAAGLTAAEYVVVVPMVPLSVPVSGAPSAQTRQNLAATASQLSFAPGSSGAGGRQLAEHTPFLLNSASGATPLASIPDDAGRWRSYATQYYPGAPTLSGTDIINLKVGEERVGVDFAMRYVPTSTISGQLIAPDGNAGEFVLRLIPSGTGEWSGEPEAALATTDASGNFMFLAVPTGSYVIQTTRVPQQQVEQNANALFSVQSRAGATANFAGLPLLPLHKEPLLWASAPVTVGDQDVGGIALTLRPGFTISGQMQFIPTGARARPEPQRIVQIPITIESADAQPRPQNGPPSRTLPDGRFITQSQQPGRYFVRIGGAPAGWMVQSVMIGGVDASDTPVELTKDVSNAVITFTDQISDLRGTVTSVRPGDDPPAIVVFPADSTGWNNFGVNPLRMRRTVAALNNGAFTFGTLPPGDYFIIAIPEEKSADWQDPAVLEILARQAARFSLAPGERRAMQLTPQDVPVGRLALAPSTGVRPRSDPAVPEQCQTGVRPWSDPTVPEQCQAGVRPWSDPTGGEQPDGSSPKAPPVHARQSQARDTRAPEAVGLGTIAGVVMQEEAGGTRPARNARVSVRGQALQGERIAMTDDQGRFAVRWLPPGSYTVQVSKAAYLPMAFGARRTGRPGAPITVEGGKPVTGIDVTLPRGAAIGGIVMDHEGQPIPNARVQVLQATTVEGQRSFTTVATSGQSTTDDRGTFRLYGLRPGSYSVMITPPAIGSGSEVRRLSDQELRAAVVEAGQAPSTPPAIARVLAPATPGPPPQVEPSGQTVSYSPVFLPGTTSENEAATITLAAGQEMTGLAVVVPLVPAARIEGVVTGLDGLPANGASVQLQRVMNYPGSFSSSVRMMDGGRFFILGVPPGQYTLSATARSQVPRPPTAPGTPPSPPTAQQIWAQETIYVGGVDQKDLRLALRPAFTMAGQMTIEGGELPPKSDVQVRLEQFVRPGAIQSTRVARIDNGTFSFANLTPGRYRLTASVPSAGPVPPGSTPAPPVWAVKSATIDGNEAYEAVVNIGADKTELSASVTLTNRLPELVGQIQNAKGELITDMSMVLFSTNPLHWSGTTSRRLRMSVRPGADGQFRFANLLPGEYYLAVLVDIENAEFNDPAFLEQLAPASIKVTLAEGDRKVQAVRVARVP